MLSLKQARVIDSVARCAELSRAAEELNMSQSTVSRSLAAAENFLAVSLFRRGWSGAEPTSEGEIVATSCSKAYSKRRPSAWRDLQSDTSISAIFRMATFGCY